MRGLSGRTYIVTGAASGIGRATAARLAEEGATVMGADLTEPSGDDGWSFTTTDVTDEDAVARLVQAAVGLGGGVDGVVTAAGVAGGGAVHMGPRGEWGGGVAGNLAR